MQASVIASTATQARKLSAEEIKNNNQNTDNYYGNLKYLVNFGGDNSNEAPKSATSLTDVSDKLYQPIKRENKIRVVKIAASGVSVGGF